MKAILTFCFSIIALLAVANAQSIVPRETITIELKGVPDGDQSNINGSYAVDAKGYIYLPLVKGGVKVSGLSSSAAARKLEGLYTSLEIYTNPRFNVRTARDGKIEQTFANKQVFFFGEISKKGALPWVENMTLEQAIANAGGITEFGTLKRVQLSRGTKTWVYDLRDVRNKRIKLVPGDTVRIPRAKLFESSGQ